MPRRSPTHLSASPDAARAAAIEGLGAQPSEGEALVVAPRPEQQPQVELTLEFRRDGAGCTVDVRAEGGVDIPFFGWFFVPLVWLAHRRASAHAIATIEAVLDGSPAPALPGPTVGLP